MLADLCGWGPALGTHHIFDGVYTGNKVSTKGSGSMCSVKQYVSSLFTETLTFTDSNFRKFDLAFYPGEEWIIGLLYVNPGATL